MEIWERSRHISRIVSGQMRFKIKDKIFYVRTPSRLQCCLADDIFAEQLEEAEADNAFTQEELAQFLEDRGIWTADDEKKLKIIYEDIEKLKIGLYEMRLRTANHPKIRGTIKKAKGEADRLELIKHSFDNQSSLGIASSIKQRFLLGCSLYIGDEPYWSDESGWESSDPYLDKIMNKVNKVRISEADYREIARLDPWRTIWNIQKHCGDSLFSGSAIDLTDEQKNLIVWSSIYESSREHPDNLGDEVINDDDMLDGWMLLKKKEREANHLKTSAEGITNNEKIKNASEQFVPVKSKEDAKRIIDMNDEGGMRVLSKRMQTIKEKGEVKEQDMPDTSANLHMQKMDMYYNNIKNKK